MTFLLDYTKRILCSYVEKRESQWFQQTKIHQWSLLSCSLISYNEVEKGTWKRPFKCPMRPQNKLEASLHAA